LQLYSLNVLANNAKKYIGILEVGNNRGAFIDKLNLTVGNKVGNPYCAAFGYYNLLETKATYPKIKSGLALNYKTGKSISAIDVAKGYAKLDSNQCYLVIWQNGNTIHGHLAIFVKQVNKNTLITIEANTSSGNYGSQSNGNGIFLRERKIVSGGLHIIAFTPVYY
jgi:hypothetical protein